MKRIILVGILCGCLLAAGCTFGKKARDAEAAKAQAQAQQKEVKAAVDDTVGRAKVELRGRMALYNKLTGFYEGTYTANENTEVAIKVRITPANEPAQAEMDRMSREADVIARLDQVGINVDIEESILGDDHLTNCRGMGLKPDFQQGQIFFDCAGQGAVSARRIYIFAFDTGDLDKMASESRDAGEAISATIGSDLVAGQRNYVGGMRLSIVLNPEYGNRFTGMLQRKGDR
jgi:hypothetical protein